MENDELVRSFLQDGLGLAGYDVDTARNGREALAMIDSGAYDLIISDLRMPGLDGAGLYDELADRGDDALARLVFLTTPHSLEHHLAFVARSGVPVLTKPVALDDLRWLAEQMTGRVAEPVPA